LRTYNLIGTVNFPTRVQGNSATAIDNTFIDITRLDNYSIRFIINGLSHHDTQSITLNTVNMSVHAKQFKLIKKLTNTINMKNGVFWDVTPCGSCKSRRFRGT
jgi:hypothetical protein